MRRTVIVPYHRKALLSLFALCLAAPALSQNSSSSAAEGTQANEQNGPVARPRAAQIDAGGASVTVETSEPLFDLAVALNTCGYDADLDKSYPVRAEVRAETNEIFAQSEPARDSRDALCSYIRQHRMSDQALDVGQYVSLALYLSPPPELTPNVSETDLPPQAAQIVNVLPLLRTFAKAIDLHFLWIHHRPEYEALIASLHDPMARMLLDTNIYLHRPVSSYDNRRFLVLLEPMLSPNLTNARIYGTDYIIVTSPDKTAPDVPVRLDQIRHIYLHYIVEPLIYSRGTAMERIQPVLRSVADAPLEFIYKSDAVALLTECLIKAIEAQTYRIAETEPKKPGANRSRVEDLQYVAAKEAYDRQTDLERFRLVSLDESQGWVLTGYFFNALGIMGRNGDGLGDEIAPMIYGMDIDRERRHAEEIVFSKTASVDPLRPHTQPRTITGMDLAELDLMKGQVDEAADLAEKNLADPKGDHARAVYILARIDLMQGDPDKALSGFELTLKQSKDPRTLAWSHIYLGRLYDSMTPPDRTKAIAEYKAGLAARDSRPDTRQAAEAGIAKPFALPQRAQSKPGQSKDSDDDFDPTGKAEKDSYKPDAPK